MSKSKRTTSDEPQSDPSFKPRTETVWQMAAGRVVIEVSSPILGRLDLEPAAGLTAEAAVDDVLNQFARIKGVSIEHIDGRLVATGDGWPKSTVTVNLPEPQ